ncbi:hypothetical protein AB0N73_06455 [Microbacterium sp. NPDC089189]|uniref:hypothetical protein n=1 Tax=Microbacterium sp. NPDC089189 TaxID=3154972 RepID=UPI00342BA1BB
MTTPAVLAASGSSFASPYSGSQLIASGQSLSHAVREGNWLDGGIAFLDTLGNAGAALADPIGTIVSAGLGWVMNYIKPLSTWLEQLAGSESNVASVAQKWSSAGGALRETGNTLAARLSDLDGLEGDTVRTYVRFAHDTAQHLSASGDWADAAAGGLMSASSLVGRMQSVVKKGISQVISVAIEAMAVVAASMGLGMGYAIARVVTKVNQVVNQVVRPLTQVLKSVKSLVGLVQQMKSLFSSTATLSSTLLGGGAQAITVNAGSVVDASEAVRVGSTGSSNLADAGREANAWSFERTELVDIPATVTPTLTADGALAGSVSMGGIGGGGGIGIGSGGGFSAYDAGSSGSTGGHGGTAGITGTGAGAAGAAAATTAAAASNAGGSRMMTAGPMSGAASRDDNRSRGMGMRRVAREIVIESLDDDR